MLVKPKCVRDAVVYLKNCKQTAEECKQISKNRKKPTAYQMPFGFNNMGSKMHSFRATAFNFCNFSIGTPCCRDRGSK